MDEPAFPFHQSKNQPLMTKTMHSLRIIEQRITWEFVSCCQRLFRPRNILLPTILALSSTVLGQTPPQILPSASLESQAVFLGQSVSFSVAASGSLPRS